MPDATTRIAALNDHTRQTFSACHVIISAGVQALEDVDAILRQVQLFDAFTPDNDPYKAIFYVCLIVCFYCHLEVERKCCVKHGI